MGLHRQISSGRPDNNFWNQRKLVDAFADRVFSKPKGTLTMAMSADGKPLCMVYDCIDVDASNQIAVEIFAR